MSKSTNILLSLFIVAAFMFAPSKAHAQCSSPTGNAGSQFFNTTYNVMQYCNGTDWVSMGSSGGIGGGGLWQTSGANIYYNSGSVGIGTDAPTALLDIAGTLYVESTITAGNAIFLANDSIVTTCSTAGAIRYNTGKSSIEVCDGTSWKSSSAGGFTQGSVPFADSAGDLTEDNTNLVWDNTGKELTVGKMIVFKGEGGGAPSTSTQSINNLSDVDLTSPSDGDILSYSSGKWQNTANSTIWTETGSDIYYNAGNVGIGTDTPSTRLEVAHSGDHNHPLWVNDPNDTTARTGIYLRTSTEGRISVGSGAAMTFYNGGADGGTERMRIAANGNVGIGNTTPAAKLDVAGNIKTANTVYIEGTNVNTGSTSLILRNSHTNGQTFALTSGIPNTNEAGFSINKLTGYSLGDVIQFISEPQLAISASSNVGIGTASPTAKLQVVQNNSLSTSSANKANAGLYIQNISNSTQLVIDSDEIIQFGNKLALQGEGGVALRVGDAAAADYKEAMFINTAGNVGIGVSTPAAKLSVAHDGGTINIGTGTNTSSYTLSVGVNDDATNFSLNTSVRRFKFSNSLGHVMFTPSNSSWAHFTTDMPNFYFNKAVHCNGGCVTYSSDKRLKKDIKPIDRGLDTLLKLNPVKFKWIDDTKNKPLVTNKNKKGYSYSFIAQELMEVAPELVEQMGKTDDPNFKEIGLKEPEEGFFVINPVGFIAPIVKAIQELSGKSDNKDAEIKELKARIEQLENAIKELQK